MTTNSPTALIFYGLLAAAAFAALAARGAGHLINQATEAARELTP